MKERRYEMKSYVRGAVYVVGMGVAAIFVPGALPAAAIYGVYKGHSFVKKTNRNMKAARIRRERMESRLEKEVNG